MKSFEYARPTTEAEVVEFLGHDGSQAAVLAGGTDLTSLMRAELVTPSRVVDLKHVSTLHEVTRLDDGIQIGSLVTLSELIKSPLLAGYQSLFDVVEGVRAIQVQGSGTIGGDLCHLPNCWYFRNGYGLLGLENGVSLPETGDNRYHAIFGNSGSAKFVSASRFAPALLAWGAKIRIVGPADKTGTTEAVWIPLEYFYTTPKTDRQGITILKPGQFVSHVWLPEAEQRLSATYEILQMGGLDWPLASASVCLDVEGGVVRQAGIVLGHVAPIPWASDEAANALVGRRLNAETAEMAADVAVSRATPLSMNEYKVQLARTAVKRVLLKATDQLDLN
jgi:xanthine dehydrogenase YagS FAD-binding subunit